MTASAWQPPHSWGIFSRPTFPVNPFAGSWERSLSRSAEASPPWHSVHANARAWTPCAYAVLSSPWQCVVQEDAGAGGSPAQARSAEAARSARQGGGGERGLPHDRTPSMRTREHDEDERAGGAHRPRDGAPARRRGVEPVDPGKAQDAEPEQEDQRAPEPAQRGRERLEHGGRRAQVPLDARTTRERRRGRVAQARRQEGRQEQHDDQDGDRQDAESEREVRPQRLPALERETSRQDLLDAGPARERRARARARRRGPRSPAPSRRRAARSRAPGRGSARSGP